jgi:putative endonuclease
LSSTPIRHESSRHSRETRAADHRGAGPRDHRRNYAADSARSTSSRAKAIRWHSSVRRRRTDAFGGAASSITRAKRSRLLAAARLYLAQLREDPPCRFDAVLIHGEPERIEWLKDAFGE